MPALLHVMLLSQHDLHLFPGTHTAPKVSRISPHFTVPTGEKGAGARALCQRCCATSHRGPCTSLPCSHLTSHHQCPASPPVSKDPVLPLPSCRHRGFGSFPVEGEHRRALQGVQPKGQNTASSKHQSWGSPKVNKPSGPSRGTAGGKCS